MTTEDHIARVKKLAESARKWEAQDDAPPYVCNCATCGVVNARLRGELTARGWDRCSVHHVSVIGNDFRGAETPFLASVQVNGAEAYRVMEDLSEALRPDVLDDIEAALKRGAIQC